MSQDPEEKIAASQAESSFLLMIEKTKLRLFELGIIIAQLDERTGKLRGDRGLSNWGPCL